MFCVILIILYNYADWDNTWGEMLPTSLPELPIELRDLRNNQTFSKTYVSFFEPKTKTVIFGPGHRFPDLWSRF